MLVMDDRTVGIIYAIKTGPYVVDVNIRKFMSEWSNSNWNWEGRDSIDRVLRQTVANYLMCCNNRYEVERYFSDSSLWIKNEYDRMISFLQQIQIRENEKYVNGMRDNPYSDFEVFKEIKV